MQHKFDVFERIQDGSLRLRATVSGRWEAQQKVKELAERSENTFFTVNIDTGKHLPFTFPDPTRGHSRSLEQQADSIDGIPPGRNRNIMPIPGKNGGLNRSMQD